MKKLPLTFFLSACYFVANAQPNYTVPHFEVRIAEGIDYGEALDFAGNNLELTLDMYYPVGDSNCLRPLLVMIHGGAFLSGTRKDPDVVAICNEMASRGYNVASIEYRLGMLPAGAYTPYALCPYSGANACIYVADKMEWERAIYRAMQDAKGAIRFLKNRADQDSTDLSNVFVGGVSAGAITAVYAGLLDEESERPSATFQQLDGPDPDPDLAGCLPQSFSTARPDLGSMEGSLHNGDQDASLTGIASFMGAVLDTTLLAGIHPPMYLYHRTDDLVVHCGWSRLFPVYWYCLDPLNLCQPNASRPFAAGSCFINNELVAQGIPPEMLFDDILDQGFPGSGDCLDNPPGHSVANIPLRCQNLSEFFSPLITATGNVSPNNCQPNATKGTIGTEGVMAFPNPLSNNQLHLRVPTFITGPLYCSVFDVTGNLVYKSAISIYGYNRILEIPELQPGLYLLRAVGNNASFVLKFEKR